MNRFKRAAASVLFLVPAVALGQDSLVGAYNASYGVTTPVAATVSLRITITSVEGSAVKATGYRSDRGCRGEYPLEGTVKENQIRLRAPQKGGPAGDCDFGIAGTIEGNVIKAKWGQRDLEFRK